MYCPSCRAEFRPGFTRCSDCDLELKEVLAPSSNPSEFAENERPDLARTSHFLAWLIPLCVYLVLFFGAWFRPSLLQNLFVELFLVSLILTANFGSFWMMYQAVRYERRVGRYVLLAFVPFMFVWYSLVRVPLRKDLQTNSEFIR
jgi:hypothetical protein